MEGTGRRIVVLGAGYAGMLATGRLAGRVRREMRSGQVTITLVNAADVFVERVRLHQLAANHMVRQRPLAGMLQGTGVAFLHGTVTGVDAARHTVHVQTAEGGAVSLGYDDLLYALGSTIDQDSVPGVREHAYTLTPHGPRSAAALREVLCAMNQAGEGRRVVVCGGGATGIEAAAEIAEAYPGLHVQLVTRGTLGHSLPSGVTDYLHRALTRLGVAVAEQTTIAAVHAGEVRTAGGAALPHDVCLWAAGFTVPALAREADLAVNERGQIVVDPFMRSVSHPGIYAVGDAASPRDVPGVAVRMAAFTAVVMGAHGADCLAAAVRGRQPRPLSFAYAGQAIALGQHDAIGFNTFPDDHPHWPYLTGAFGARVRDVFVRLLASLPDIERRWPGAFTWLGKGRYAAQQRRQLREMPGPHRA